MNNTFTSIFLYTKRLRSHLLRWLWRNHLRARGLTTRKLVCRAEKAGDLFYGEVPRLLQYPHSDYHGAPNAFQQHLPPIDPHRAFVCTIQNCTIIGPGGVGFAEDGRLILETFGSNADVLLNRWNLIMGDRPLWRAPVLSKRELQLVTTIAPNTIFPLLPIYQHYYYHWILLYLPRIRMLQQYERLTNDFPKLLIQPDAPRFVRETLSLLGYNEDRILEHRSKGIRAEKLVITNYPVHLSEPYLWQQIPDGYFWLRDRMRDAFRENPPPNLGARIFVSRQKAKRGRRILNFAAVAIELERHGFEIVNFECLSSAEQIQKLMHASVIMGPHGAGLANMIFADNPLIIEILPRFHVERPLPKAPFYFVARAMGFDYRCLIARDVGGDLDVDVDALRGFLAETL